MSQDAVALRTGIPGLRKLGWPDLAGQHWVLPPKESLLRRAFIEAHLLAGLPLPTPSVELMSPISVSELLLHDCSLLGVMRREQGEAEHASGRLMRLPVSPQLPLPALAFITLVHHGQLPTMLAAFRAALMEVGEMPTPVKRSRGKLSRPAWPPA